MGGVRKDRRPFFIAAAVLLAYLTAIKGGPLWDGFGHITAPEFRSLGGHWRIWSELGATQQYYPLLHSTFWLEHRLWGDAFAGYHLANVAFHAAPHFSSCSFCEGSQYRGHCSPG